MVVWPCSCSPVQVMLGHQPTLELGDVIELPALGPAPWAREFFDAWLFTNELSFEALQATVNSSDQPEAVASLKLLPAQVHCCTWHVHERSRLRRIG